MPYNPSWARKDTRAGSSLCFYSNIKCDRIISQYELTGYFVIGIKGMKERRKGLAALGHQIPRMQQGLSASKIFTRLDD